MESSILIMMSGSHRELASELVLGQPHNASVSAISSTATGGFVAGTKYHVYEMQIMKLIHNGLLYNLDILINACFSV